MLTDTQREQLKQALRPMQIIVLALAMGVISFFVATLFIRSLHGGNGAGNSGFATNAGLGSVIFGSIAWVVLRNIISSHTRRSTLAGDARRLTTVYQTRLIISCALLEGIVFFNLVAYLIEGQRISLICAGAFLFIMLCQFPTLDRMERWVESELVAVEQLRQLEPPRV